MNSRRIQKIFLNVAIFATILSLTAYLWMSSAEPMAAYFLLPFRIWEMTLGCILGATIFLGRSNYKSNKLTLLQFWLNLTSWAIIAILLFLIAAPTSLINIEWLTIATCASTGLLIISGQDFKAKNSLYNCQEILKVKPLVFIGTISYSLYLWHYHQTHLHKSGNTHQDKQSQYQ